MIDARPTESVPRGQIGATPGIPEVSTVDLHSRVDALRVLLACDKLGYGDERLHGIGRLVVDWTRGLMRAGVDVTTVVLRHPGPLAEELEKESLPFVYLGRSPFDPLTVSDLVRLIRDRKIQVVHLQNYGASALGRVAARWCGVPAIVHVHSNLLERPLDYPRWLRVLDRALRPWTASCIAVSQAAARSAIEVQGFGEDSLHVLPNPIDLKRFRPPDPESARAARRELGVFDDEPVVLCVARLFPVKGVDRLLDAWSIVERRLPYGRLVIAGDGPERADLEARAKSLRIERLRFLGHRADIESVFRAADLLVVSSRSETGPLVGVEAMATGLPVVAFRVGGVGELVRDRDEGILLDPGDIEAMAEAIALLMSDGALRRRLGTGALARSKLFGIDRFIERLVEEYRRVLR